MQTKFMFLALFGLFFMLSCNVTKKHKITSSYNQENDIKNRIDSGAKSLSLSEFITLAVTNFEGNVYTPADSAETNGVIFGNPISFSDTSSNLIPYQIEVKAKGGRASFTYDPKTKKAALKLNIDSQKVQVPGQTISYTKKTDLNKDSTGKKVELIEKSIKAGNKTEIDKQTRRLPLDLIIGIVLCVGLILLFIFFSRKKL